jgi:hypothetical protein
MSGKPLAIDLFAGLGGWAEGLLLKGYDVVGFDLEAHWYGDHRYPAQLVIQDVLTLHGSQFCDAALIVASPPCQAYSYRAMPWKRAKALPLPDNTLFEACFRIQREACEAAGRHIPMIVENVRGAQPWVGQARWNYGSFYLWGDVPALMPHTVKRPKVPGFRFDGSGQSFQTAAVDSYKSTGMNWGNREIRGQDFTRIAGNQAIKNNGGSWFNIAHNTTSGVGNNPDGRKVGKDWFGGYGGGFGWDSSPMRRNNSRSPQRKAASAMIAKIPLPLSVWIASVYLPPP